MKKIILLLSAVLGICLLTLLTFNLLNKKGVSDRELIDFSISDTSSVDRIEITDALGQVIYANKVKPISNEYKIDIQGFLDGIYFINIMNDNSKQTFKLLVKNN